MLVRQSALGPQAVDPVLQRGGAAVEGEYLGAIRGAGFEDVQVLQRLDYFGQSGNENTRRLTKSFGAESVVVRARKP